MANSGDSSSTPLRRFAALLTGVLLLSAIAGAETPLVPHTAEYRIKINVLGGQLRTELKSDGDAYIATHIVKPTGMSRILANGAITESSSFLTAADGIRPDKYWSVDSLSRDKSRVEIHFDWDSGEARGTVNEQAVLSTMDALAHDRISIQYELMHDLLNGEPSKQYTLFDVDKLKTINVRNIGRKTVKVRAGQFEAVGIQHQAENSKRVTTLWCVEELGYLPVIIEQHRLGKLRMRATLASYTPT
ncbi:MAG: DUF3108 domain-containing protein [Gammaproteobacteria bacterium]|nr:DUF3108 domain-containing protein [Gammaproteobacteria bacterium]MDH3417412.1 DUF3108 domain-containing protein [Gammaproteobacteria bacterium]